MDALSMLLGDFDRADFFRDIWDKKSHYFAHNDDRFKEFMCYAELREQLDKCAISKAMYKDERGYDKERIIKGEDVNSDDKLTTLCATYLEKYGVREAFLRSLHEQVKSLSDYYFNCYYSPQDHGYCLHIDPHPVWILQVEGMKEWTFAYETVCESPQHAFIMQPGKDSVRLPWGHFERPKPEALQTVILCPGDALYLPAGCWHAARAHEGSSLALTLAHARISSLDIFGYMLQRLLPSRTDLMKRLPGSPVAAERGDIDDLLWPHFVSASEQLQAIFSKALQPENIRREYYMHIERKKNFPQFYQMEMKAPESLRADADEAQAKQANVKLSDNSGY